MWLLGVCYVRCWRLFGPVGPWAGPLALPCLALPWLEPRRHGKGAGLLGAEILERLGSAGALLRRGYPVRLEGTGRVPAYGAPRQLECDNFTRGDGHLRISTSTINLR